MNLRLTVQLLNEYQTLRLTAAMVALASIFALGFAYTAQYGFDMQPCILCLYQRWPYRIAIGIGVFAFIMARHSEKLTRRILWLAPLAFIVDAGIAFFQVGVEQKWWHGFTGCSAPDLSKLSGAELYAAIQSAPVVSCDVIQFELFGISMAGYNGLFALGLAVATALALRYLPLKNVRPQG
jgi:disulfide bond formation protein DsbB